MVLVLGLRLVLILVLVLTSDRCDGGKEGGTGIDLEWLAPIKIRKEKNTIKQN